MFSVDPAKSSPEAFGRSVRSAFGAPLRNASVRVILVNGTPHLGIFAIEHVLPGDEIVYDSIAEVSVNVLLYYNQSNISVVQVSQEILKCLCC